MSAFALPPEQAEELHRLGPGRAEPVRHPGAHINADLVTEETDRAVADRRDLVAPSG